MYPVNLPVDLDWLKRYELFREHDPVIPIDVSDPELSLREWEVYRGGEAGSVRDMILACDTKCRDYMGHRPPSQGGLFLAQFPDTGPDDAAFALAALHFHREIGAGYCAAAIWIEALEFDEVAGARIQRRACYCLSRHPWASGRHMIEKTLRSSKIKWLSPEGKGFLEASVRANHPRHAAFFAQKPLHHHPLHDGSHRA